MSEPSAASVQQIINYNVMLRKMDFFKSAKSHLFFGGNGCGDYFCYNIDNENPQIAVS